MKRIVDFIQGQVRIDRNELSGAFGDIGTDLPLILGMILASGIDGSGVFMMFGAMQIATALIYGIPMPVQPLKAVALLVITQKLGGDLLYGGGLAIGVVMLLLTVNGGDRSARKAYTRRGDTRGPDGSRTAAVPSCAEGVYPVKRSDRVRDCRDRLYCRLRING